MKIWAFLYNDNTWESAACTISLHLTEEGAEKAMEHHKQEHRKEYESIWDTEEDKRRLPYEKYIDNAAWFINEMEVQP